jgi:hypothetical protein
MSIDTADRISALHLKRFIGALIKDKPTKREVLALVDRYVDTAKADKAALVDGLQQLLISPKEGRANAVNLVEMFGKAPPIIIANTKNP